MTATRWIAPLALTGVVVASGVAYAADDGDDDCNLPQGDEVVAMDPADFSATITNRWWPMRPGARWTFVERDADGGVEHIVVEVLRQTKVIAGISARVVRDTVRGVDGELIEDTFDWYAQDRDGNLWYLGEDTKEYEGGEVVSTEGSWEHGVDGALAGVLIPGDPEPGCAFRQEFYEGEAEDNGQVLATNDIAEVPAGRYRDVLATMDTTPLEPWVSEHKLYAPGVGPVLTVQVAGGTARGELISKR